MDKSLKNRQGFAYVIIGALQIVLMFVEVFLLLRFVLKLFGANAYASFVAWIYATTDPLLEPFKGAFSSPILENGFILEFSTLFAILLYSIIGWLIIELISFISSSAKMVKPKNSD